jgi:hypothetical protein
MVGSTYEWGMAKALDPIEKFTTWDWFSREDWLNTLAGDERMPLEIVWRSENE